MTGADARIVAPERALARLEMSINDRYTQLRRRAAHPESTRPQLLADLNRLAGLIEAHLIITGPPVPEPRARLQGHAATHLNIDLAALGVAIQAKGR